MVFSFIDTSHLYLVGILSMAFSLAAFAPYILDILHGTTQPHRASWFIWAVVSSSSFLSQAYEGADTSLLFAGMQAMGATTILVLSIKRGIGTFFYRASVFRFAALGGAYVLSYVQGSAGFVLAACICISAVAGVSTIRKAYADPESETLLAWFAFFLGAVLALISVGELDWMLMVFPFYLVTLYGSILTSILVGRLRATKAAPHSV